MWVYVSAIAVKRRLLMSTLSELRDLVRSQTLVESDDYTDAKVNRLINQGLGDLSTRFEWPWLATSSTIAVVGGTEAYAIPATADRLAKLMIAGESRPLTEVSAAVAWEMNGDDPSSGSPTWFFLWGESIYLRPVPASAASLKVFYWQFPTFLTSEGAVPQFNPQFHHILGDYAMQMLWEREEDFEKASVYAQRYAAGVETMARFYLNRAKDAPFILGEPGRMKRGPRMPWLEL